MKILGVETSSSVAGCAICDDGLLVYENNFHNTKTHSQIIMPMIDSMLKTCGLTLADMDAFAVDIGPGSFTGLRIGTATVKGFAHALDKPVIGVSSLKTLAYNVISYTGIICSMIDARCEQCYCAVYKSDGETLTTLIEDTALPISDLCGQLAAYGERVLCVGDGSLVYRETIQQQLKSSVLFAGGQDVTFRASSLCAAAQAQCVYQSLQKANEVVPVYLRKPQAQRERERRLKEHDSNRQ